jgi:DNA-binding MarR family transcriptional regulator
MPAPVLLDRLLEVSELFQRDMARAFDGTALSSARMRVLWVIHHTGPLTQQSLATHLGVTPRNVSGLVDALEATGFVARSPHPTDRRATLVTLTATGAQLMARTVREHADLSTTLLAAVQPDDRASLERGLDAVLARLRGLVADAEAGDSTNVPGEIA